MIASIVARGFGTFGGGVHKLPTRGYSIAAAIVIPGPYYFVVAVLYAAGSSAGTIYVAGASDGGFYEAGASSGQFTTE